MSGVSEELNASAFRVEKQARIQQAAVRLLLVSLQCLLFDTEGEGITFF
jgi:hypothetical protein